MSFPERNIAHSYCFVALLLEKGANSSVPPCRGEKEKERERENTEAFLMIAITNVISV
jgi:hypothetical protein